MQVSFSNDEKFKEWGLVFVESIKSDEALRQSQIIEPLREKLEKDR